MTRGRVLGVNAVAALLYFALSSVALGLSQVGIAAPLWPAAGLAFAFALRWGWTAMPGIALGSVAGNLAFLHPTEVTSGEALVAALVVAVGAVLQAQAGAWLVRRYVGTRSPLVGPRDILLFLLLSGPVAAVINATVGTASQLVSGILSTAQVGAAWLTWWAGDAMGIIIFGPITMMFLPDQRDIWAGRRWKIAVPATLLAAATAGVITVADTFEHDRVREQEDQFVSEAASALRAELELQQEVLQGVKGLVLASDVVDVGEFATFTQVALDRFPSLGAVSWNPVVDGAELAAFEAQQRQQPALASFEVTERDADGNPQPVGVRDSYVVVQYIEPLASNQAALGFDISSNPSRQETIEAARDSGRTTATPPIDLVQDSGSQKGMLVLAPVYAGVEDPPDEESRRSTIRGYAVGVYRLGDLLTGVFAGARWDDFDLALIDVTDGAEPQELAQSAARSPAQVDRAQGANEPVLSEPFEVNGRTWVLSAVPVAGPLAQVTVGVSPFLLLVSLAGLYLLQSLLLLLTGLEAKARREVAEKSYEANHDALTELMNRRGFIRRLEELCEDSAENPATHLLLYADLDGFKEVNDRAGHEAGDDMLIAVARAIQRSVRSVDVVARIGGDEFAVILVDCPVNVGMRTAHGIVAGVEDIRLPERPGDLTVGISIGATAFGAGGSTDPDEVLRQADTAAYAAKRAEGVRVRRHGEAEVVPSG